MRPRNSLSPLILLVFSGVCWAQTVGAKQLVGTWNLVSFVDTPEGGTPLYAHGEHPVGQFIYTADGHVSVHIMHDPADPKPAPEIPGLEATPRYVGYFGTYTVLESEGVVVHHVIGGNLPSYINTDQRRPFQLRGDRLTISGIRTASGGVRVRWERILVRASTTPQNRSR
jgi:hypothetical protein